MGIRIIKTAIATLLAILITDAFNIPGATSAGLLAILGVDVTRKRSLRSVSSRFFASILGLMFASVLFQLLGYHYWVLALYILIAFPAISKANFKEGIVTSSVVVFRVFSEQELDLHIFWTQIELLVIGLGSAMLVNMAYMPKGDERLTAIRREVDGLFSAIFKQISLTLTQASHVWDGKELIEANQAVQRGVTESNRALENQMLHPDLAWNVYFYMRKEQLDNIQAMMHLVSQIYEKLPTGEFAAELFDQMSKDVIAEEYTGKTEKLLQTVKLKFQQMDLPQTREEFEVRSAILQLCRELESFLRISKRSKAPTSTAGKDAENRPVHGDKT
ncbi:aromatic acid exporter family protein [Paenibacillus lemnae]|uniref:Aromatic acid exporter family protein n=1 Tax=Paenibacillus lemnae TaxID=1330551 RepID=A0A848M9Z7_PAELE|nr:aromatic acid exporter family protein [Paenibacillus lemnae]NMO97079.1 aromatic acid exporter family protein [Paenibacillus lemnae]